MSVVQAQLATVQAQLAEIEAAITEAKAHYRLAALDAALDPAKQEVADAAIAALDALHRRRQMLQEALVLAEEREVSRVDERDAKDRAAKARALSQHLAAFEKAGQAIADAQETLQYKFSAAMKAAQSAAALLPNHLRWA